MAPSPETQPAARPDSTTAARNLEQGHDWNNPKSTGNQSIQSEVNSIRDSFIDKNTHKFDEAGYRTYVDGIYNTIAADARHTADPHLPDLMFDFDQADRKEPHVGADISHPKEYAGLKGGTTVTDTNGNATGWESDTKNRGLLTSSDGSRLQAYYKGDDGNTRVEGVDKNGQRYDFEYGSGVTATVSKDGNIGLTFPDGKKGTVNSDGAETVDLGDGRTVTRPHPGSTDISDYTVTDARGDKKSIIKDGQWGADAPNELKDLSASKFGINPANGDLIVKGAEGASLKYDKNSGKFIPDVTAGIHTETKDGWEILSDQSGAPKQVKKGDVVAKIPEGASGVEIKNGLVTYKTKAGVEVDLDEKGTPKTFHSGGFSVERHDDQQWYYHQDSGGDYVKLNGFKMNQDGTVTATEGGLLNSGRQHTLTGTGQSTESAFSSKLRNLGKDIDLEDLKNGIENGSIRDLQRFGARNAGLLNPATDPGAIMGLGLDSAGGSDTYGVQSSVMTGIAKTLVDGTMDGAGWLLSHGQFALAQTGLEAAGIIPKMPHLDQLIPQSNLIPGPDGNAPAEERAAFQVGEVAGYFVPFAGQAGDAIRAPRAIMSAVREGRVLSSLGDGVSSFVAKGKDVLQGLVSKPEEMPKTEPTSLPREVPKSVQEEAPKPFVPAVRYEVQENAGKNGLPGREVNINGEVYQVSKHPFQKWFYGGRGEGANSPVKIHVATDSPEDLGKLQQVLIPALTKDPELSRLVGDWKTFDPLHGTNPSRATGSAPDGLGNNAKAFTIYPENAGDAQRIQQRIDEILAQNGLSRDSKIPTGNVDEISGRSNRVGIVRDQFEPAMINGKPAGAELPQQLVAAIQKDKDVVPGAKLNREQLSDIEQNLHLKPGILVYDDAGKLTLRSISINSKLNENGSFYLTEEGAGKGGTTDPFTDRPAIYELAHRYGVDLSSLS